MHLNLLVVLYVVMLFILFVPGVMMTLPSNKSRHVLLVHALLFALIWTLTHHYVWEETKDLPTNLKF